MRQDGPHPLWDVVIGNHPIERYEYWRTLLRQAPVPGLSTRDEIRLWMTLATPCDGLLPESVIQRRLENHDGQVVSYWRRHPWRFVVFDGWRLFTVEPDAYPHLLGAWRNVKEVRGVWGDPHDLATVEEISRSTGKKESVCRANLNVNQGGPLL